MNNIDISNILEGTYSHHFFIGSIKNKTKTYDGLGKVYLKHDKKLFCEFYSKYTTRQTPLIFSQDTELSGQLYNTDSYFKLSTEFMGIKWVSNEFLTTNTHESIDGIYFNQEINYIANTIEQKTNNKLLWIIDTVLEIPLNKFHENDGIRTLSLFDEKVGNLEIKIQIKKNTYTELMIFDNNSENFEKESKKFIEALKIFIGLDFYPLIEIKSINNITTKTIYTKTKTHKTLSIFNHKFPSSSKNMKEFIQCYLNNTEDNLLFTCWEKIAKHSDALFEVQCLNYTIAIEQILNSLYKLSYIPPYNEFIRIEKSLINLENCKNYFDKRSLEDLNYSLKLKTSPNPKKLLENLNFINKNHIKSWGKIRNSLAHGANLSFQNDKEAQKIVDHFHNCAEAFFLLIFDRIKFKGVFLNISTHGWPEIENISSAIKYTFTTKEPQLPLVPFIYDYNSNNLEVIKSITFLKYP